MSFLSLDIINHVSGPTHKILTILSEVTVRLLVGNFKLLKVI